MGFGFRLFHLSAESRVTGNYEASRIVFLEDGSQPEEVTEPSIDLVSEWTRGDLEGSVLLGKQPFVDGSRTV